MTSSPTPLRAYGYIRVSTEEQTRHGVSLADQHARLTAYCTGAGLALERILREAGVSGGTHLANRPQGKLLLQLLGQHRPCALVVTKLDRLFRTASDALAQSERWAEQGVQLHILDMGGQSLNTGSAIGKLFFTITAGFAEMERNLIRERTTAALQHKKATGQVYSPTPFGYTRLGARLVEDPDEQNVIAALALLARIGMSYYRLARLLAAAGVATKRGGAWHSSTVHYLLHNDLYTPTLDTAALDAARDLLVRAGLPDPEIAALLAQAPPV